MKLRNTLLLLISFLTLQSSYAQKFNLLIGTYTSPGKSEGIYVYEFDAKTGDLTYLNKAAGITSPSYLAIAPDGKHVYAVNEGGRGNGGLSAFAYTAKTGELKLLNKTSSGGDGPCYVSVDASGKFVFVANYSGGTISATPILTDGSLGTDIQALTFQGNGPNTARQNKPYLHCVELSPDGKFLFANDLGTDKTYVYQIDASKKSSPLIPSEPSFVSVQAGSGPRHSTFHPNKKYAYLLHEMGGIVSAFSYSNGKLDLLQTASILPEGFTGKFTAADIHVSPDGKFLYASNRGDLNELVIFSIDGQSGKLSYAGRQSSLGKTPRNFVIDPTGNYLLVANQSTDDIFVFKRDKKTGLLTPTGKKMEISKAVCLKFGSRQ